MKTSKELRQDLGEKNEEMRAILDRTEGRKRTLGEEQELHDLDNVMNGIEADIARAERSERIAQPRSGAIGAIRPDVAAADLVPRTGSRWLNAKTGKEVRALTPKESFAEAAAGKPEDRDLSFGRWAYGWATGQWDHVPAEKRLLSVGGFAAGGATVPAPLANQVIDLARSRSVVINMGAQTIPMDAPTLDLIRIVSDPTAQFFGGDEIRTSGITESQGSFGRLQLQSQTMAILERISVELAEDCAQFAMVFENAIANAAALAIDKYVLYGATARDGLRTYIPNDATNSINEVTAATNGDQVTDYSKFISAAQKVLEGNCPLEPAQLGLVWAPRTWGTVTGLKEGTTNAPLRGPDFFQKMQKLTSTQISIAETQGSSSIASTAFLGDWSQVLLGVRTDPRIELSREAGDSFSRLHVLLRLYARVDFVVLQPKFITRIIGLVP
jgi:HK97 family phage major capsid protein